MESSTTPVNWNNFASGGNPCLDWRKRNKLDIGEELDSEHKFTCRGSRRLLEFGTQGKLSSEKKHDEMALLASLHPLVAVYKGGLPLVVLTGCVFVTQDCQKTSQIAT